MERILSIDPGHKTGIAVFDEKGELRFSMVVDYETCTYPFFSNLLEESQPDVVLLEEVPERMVDRKTLNLWVMLHKWTRLKGIKIEHIAPSQWKGLVKREKIDGSHAIDAATMARWYMQSKERR